MSRIRAIPGPLFRTASAALVLFAVLLTATVQVARMDRSREVQALRSRVTETLASLRVGLEAELNANVYLANGLAANVIAMPDSIDQAMRVVHDLGRHVRNVGVAPGNRLSHIYPLEGNEAAIGLYYPDHPKQWPSARRAIESGTTVLAGPVPLVQGGNGLISRTPVFRDDGTYWGLLSIVLDADSLFETVGLAPQKGGIRYAMRGRDGTGRDGPLILGRAELFTPAANAVTMAVGVPGGTWVMAAAPIGGWLAAGGIRFGFEVIGALLSAGLAVLAFLFLHKREQLKISERRARAFLSTTPDGVIVIGQDGLIREFNPGAEAMLGYDAAEVLGKTVNGLMFPDIANQHDGFVRAARADAVRAMGRRLDVVARHKSGRAVPVEIMVSKTAYGGEWLHVGILRDITDRKALEHELRVQADTDGLTGLLNRRALLAALERAFELAKRHGRPLSLLTLDADHFKQVNDTHGHPAGDAVLVELARMATTCLRTSDRLGRIGGEEFAVLLPETDEAGAVRFADRLLAAIRSIRVDIDGGPTLCVTVSIGIVSMSDAATCPDDLLRAADQALYAAKTGGRDRWAIRSVDQISAIG
jgi:diguanylate cyclase (GGDEF)-like protein/PAS domain S-box-containing protein